jgi:hypothetical protein
MLGDPETTLSFFFQTYILRCQLALRSGRQHNSIRHQRLQKRQLQYKTLGLGCLLR